ncbi:MAG TPA: hypothetical protein VIY90_22995 [Steroidobacteraceae bacterium]
MHSAALPATLKLHGLDRARYFAPVAFLGFLAALCVALITVSAFLVTMRDALAIAAAGLFGLVLTGAAGAVILKLQLRWLRYASIPIGIDRDRALASMRHLVIDAGWRITRQEASGLEARTPGTMFAEGERIYVEFRDREVLVASICDPDVGFSLVGHQRCLQHCERVRRALLATCNMHATDEPAASSRTSPLPGVRQGGR